MGFEPKIWIPSDSSIKLSKDSKFLLLIAEGKLYSVPIELLLELVAGHRERLYLSYLEKKGNAGLSVVTPEPSV